MYIYNITFMTERSAEHRLVEWLRGHKGKAVLSGDAGVAGCRLQTVVDVPGESEFAEQALSLALQVDFETMDDARTWGRTHFNAMHEDFRKEFGQESLCFCTILRTIAF